MSGVLKWSGVGLGAVLLGFIVMNWQYVAAAADQSQMFRDPVFDHDPPTIGDLHGAVAIVAFSKTNGYRHHQSIPAARMLLDNLAAQNDWAVFHTENAAVFNDPQLARFDVVVLNNSTGNLYTDAQRQAFKAFIETGGGVVAIHAAGDNSGYEWAWYLDEVIRAYFVDHPMAQHIQEATLKVEQPDHPIVQHLDATWVRSDEWYNFAENPRARVNVLLTIDEGTYDPERSPMGRDHPMVWWHALGEGRVFYSALGHVAGGYAEPKYAEMLASAIRWATHSRPEPLEGD